MSKGSLRRGILEKGKGRQGKYQEYERAERRKDSEKIERLKNRVKSNLRKRKPRGQYIADLRVF
jgi:hypothetical protein